MGYPRQTLERCVHESKNTKEGWEPQNQKELEGSPAGEGLRISDSSFLAFWFQAVREAEGSYCCKPGAEVTGGRATGPYNGSPMCHTYYGLQKAVWGAEANDLCGWAPGTKVRLQVLSACCPDPTPAKRGRGAPEKDEGVREGRLLEVGSHLLCQYGGIQMTC